MPSVMGLLEERERVARQRVDALQAELREAEAVWERFVIARETVGEVLAEPRGGEDVVPVVVAGERPVQVRQAVPGSVVPRCEEGLAPAVLAPDYQRIMDVLAGGNGMSGEAMDCRQLAAASGWSRSRRRWKGCGRKPSGWPRGAGWRRSVRGCSACPSGEAAAHDRAHRPLDHCLRGVGARLVVAGQSA